jgi:hypothetical protein
MLLKVIGQSIGCTKRVYGSHWEMRKGYWIASGHFLQGVGKLLGNAQITQIATGQMFLLAGCYEKSRNKDHQALGYKAEFAGGYRQKHFNFCPFCL